MLVASREGPGPLEQARLVRLLGRPTVEAARALLGCILLRHRRGGAQAVRIVETEAYLGPEDPAAHAFSGRTPRNAPLWAEPGTIYVYRIYGMHHCLNLAVDRPGFPGCVLVRAAEPLPGSGLGDLECRGPGRLCRALEIDRRLSGRRLFEADAPLTLRAGVPPPRIGVSPRVGIRRAAERPLRFYDAASAAVSVWRPPPSLRPASSRRDGPVIARASWRRSR